MAYVAELDKDFARFKEDFDLVGTHLGRAQTKYAEADKRLDKFGTKLERASEDEVIELSEVVLEPGDRSRRALRHERGAPGRAGRALPRRSVASSAHCRSLRPSSTRPRTPTPRDPGTSEPARRRLILCKDLSRRQCEHNDDVRELIIIGGGPAGYTAALYAARADLKPARDRGLPVGRPADDHERRRELPRLRRRDHGPEMMEDFRRQAERFGAEFVTDDVTKVDFSERPFRVWVRQGRVPREVGDRRHRREARAGSGSSPEQRLQGRGVSACATCDGAFFKEKHDRRRRRRRLRVRGGALPDALRHEGDARPPARRVPRLADHGQPRPRERQDRVR